MPSASARSRSGRTSVRSAFPRPVPGLAAMESFFSLLQNNVLDREVWGTRHELRMKIATWIERTYHRRRKQKELGRMTPVQFEAHLLEQAVTLAA